MKRFLWLGFVLFLYLICTGCGDTFRPIIIPNPPTFPNPRAAHSVVSINDNGSIAVGSAMVIDVSGDTDVSVRDVGLAPVHAVQQTASEVLVVNHSVPGPLNTGDSLTRLNFNGTVIASANTISLPPNSAPNFVASAPNDSIAYVTLPSYVPDPVQSPNDNGVALISTQSNTWFATATAGVNPFALAATPDRSKLYVANNSSPCKNPVTPDVCSISSFNVVRSGTTASLSARTGSPVSTSSPPVWLVSRTDSQRVYTLESSGVLAQLDSTATAGPDLLTEYPSISVPGATTMFYDSNKNRLYIPGGQQVAIVDVSQSDPQLLAGAPITIPPVAPSSRSAADPCLATSQQTLNVVAVAALPDGTRAYVGAYYVDASDNVCPQVTVIDVASNTVRSSTAVPGFPDATNPASLYYVPACSTTRFRFTMAAGGDSTRVYLGSCDGGNVNIIDTSVDRYIQNLPAPVGSRPPIPPSALNPPQNPVFLLAGP
jgi:hypothetical protein